MDNSDKLFFGTILALFALMTGHAVAAFWIFFVAVVL